MKLIYGWSEGKFVLVVVTDENEPQPNTVLHQISMTQEELTAITEEGPKLKDYDGLARTLDNHTQMR